MICPPGGSAVAALISAACTAADTWFSSADWYRCTTITGVSGAAALISLSVP